MKKRKGQGKSAIYKQYNNKLTIGYILDISVLYTATFNNYNSLWIKSSTGEYVNYSTTTG